MIGAKMIHMTTVHAQSPDGTEEPCDERDREKYPHRPEVPSKITEPAEEGEEKSQIVKELLKLIDEFDDDEFGDDADDKRDLLRKVLREADPELARSLGKNSLRLIQQANQRPPVIDIAKHCYKQREKKAEEEEKPETEDKPDDKDPVGEDPFGDL